MPERPEVNRVRSMSSQLGTRSEGELLHRRTVPPQLSNGRAPDIFHASYIGRKFASDHISETPNNLLPLEC
jgi:hypothetical protein